MFRSPNQFVPNEGDHIQKEKGRPYRLVCLHLKLLPDLTIEPLTWQQLFNP